MASMHHRVTRLFILFCLSFTLGGDVSSAETSGRGFFEKGLFDFEAGLYDEAIISFDKALSTAPGNAVYHHYLGKAYAGREALAEAAFHLKRAFDLDPELADLRYDLALVYFRQARHGQAAEMFAQASIADSENTLAVYYAGLSAFEAGHVDRALPFFIKAGDRNPDLRVHAAYYAGICHFRGGRYTEAVQQFQYVKDNAVDPRLRSDAERRLERIRKDGRRSRPYSLYLKTGVQYDDFTRLDPLEKDLLTGIDLDVDKNEEDLLYAGFFSGRYNVVNRDRLVMGAAYSHYQTWHRDLTRYDLVGSVGNLFVFYRMEPLAFAFSYVPSYYLLDGDSYLRRHLLRPEIVWRINASFSARLTHRYYTHHYFKDGYKSGYGNEIVPSLTYRLPSSRGAVSVSVGYEKNRADHPDEEYVQWTVRMESLLNMPLAVKLRLLAAYNDKRYDNVNSYYGRTREDARYSGTVSLTRAIYRDIVEIQGEFNYTENDSRIPSYDYRRRTSTLALVLTY